MDEGKDSKKQPGTGGRRTRAPAEIFLKTPDSPEFLPPLFKDPVARVPEYRNRGFW